MLEVWDFINSGAPKELAPLPAKITGREREKMAVIHSGLFLIMKRFPDRKDALLQMHRTSESFRSICENYQECLEALRYWAESEHETAVDRHREYASLLHELEEDVRQNLSMGLEESNR